MKPIKHPGATVCCWIVQNRVSTYVCAVTLTRKEARLRAKIKGRPWGVIQGRCKSPDLLVMA